MTLKNSIWWFYKLGNYRIQFSDNGDVMNNLQIYKNKIKEYKDLFFQIAEKNGKNYACETITAIISRDLCETGLRLDKSLNFASLECSKILTQWNKTIN